jgi:hypothetical protein
MVRCTVACLGVTRSQRSRLVLAPVAPCVLAPRNLSQMCKYEMPTNIVHGVQRGVCYTLMHNLTILNPLQTIY